MVGIAITVSTSPATAQGLPAAEDPPVPPANPTSRADLPGETAPVRVALVDSGVNYTLPVIHSALARDERGQLIGEDFWDLDGLPFDAHPAPGGRLIRHGTKTASVLIREAPNARLVPYRYPRPDMTRMADLIEHASANDVRIIGLPLGGNRQDDWLAFEKAAVAHPDMLFVASAGNNGRDIDQVPVYPASLPLDNLLVVTSSDDFVRPAERVNWGRSSVDYLVPAENLPVIEFDGAVGVASGSSYAVPRLVALGARLLARHPHWQAPELIAEIRRRFANGAAPRHVSSGYLADPLSTEFVDAASRLERVPLELDQGDGLASQEPDAAVLRIPLDVLRIDPDWSMSRMRDALVFASRVLSQCNMTLSDITLARADVPDHLRDLASGPSHTLMNHLRRTGPERRLTIVFARDTRMAMPFDAEAFGRANTRSRPWLQDSIWLTSVIEDEGIALAHELWHVLANSGEHVEQAGNLMQRRTSGDNTALSLEQCRQARNNAERHSLLE